MDENMQELLDRLEYMENALGVLLQLTTLNTELTTDVYNIVAKAGMRAGIVGSNVVNDDLN